MAMIYIGYSIIRGPSHYSSKSRTNSNKNVLHKKYDLRVKGSGILKHIKKI